VVVVVVVVGGVVVVGTLGAGVVATRVCPAQQPARHQAERFRRASLQPRAPETVSKHQHKHNQKNKQKLNTDDVSLELAGLFGLDGLSLKRKSPQLGSVFVHLAFANSGPGEGMCRCACSDQFISKRFDSLLRGTKLGFVKAKLRRCGQYKDLSTNHKPGNSDVYPCRFRGVNVLPIVR
jgi:hypothetical protein